jgi:hypothetical protein
MAEIPTFLYLCEGGNDLMQRVNLLTGEKSYYTVFRYQFGDWCRWSELPGGNVLITGGSPGVRDVVMIDPSRDWAVSSQPPMHTARGSHAALYHSQYVYVLGGTNGSPLSECERYSCAESRWEVLPPLPVAAYQISALEVENSVYALGGRDDSNSLDTVQKLSLDSLTWELMQLRLPLAAYSFACFKRDTEVYLVIEYTLYSFTPLQVNALRTLDQSVGLCYSSYYSRGTLYCEWGRAIGSLSFN